MNSHRFIPDLYSMIHRSTIRFAVRLMIIASVSSAVFGNEAPTEDDYYRIVSIPIPDNIYLEVGGLEMMPDEQIAVSSRRGDVYTISGATQKNPSNVKFTKFASGLHEVLGLSVHNGQLYATQRGEVSRLVDNDKDGRADLYQTVSDGWGINGDYHEYAFGSKFDPDGIHVGWSFV